MPARSEDYWHDAPRWIKVIVVAVAFLAAAELGNALSIQHAFSTFWPPAGVLFVLLVLAEPREWPLILGVAACANVGSDLAHGRELVVSLGFVVANCAEATLGAYLVRRSSGVQDALETRKGIIRFVAFAVVAAPAVGAAIGTIVIALSLGPAEWWRVWATWWSGDALGVLVVGALGLAIADADRRRRGGVAWIGPPRDVGVFLAIVVAVAVAGWWIAAMLGPLSGWKFVLFLAVLLAIRFGSFGVASAGLVISVATEAGLHARWQSVQLTSGVLTSDVVTLQAFLAVLLFVGLFIAAAITETQSAVAAERMTTQKYRVLLETLPVGVTISDAAGEIVETSTRSAEILDVSAAEHKGRNIAGSDWRILAADGSELPSAEWVSVRALNEGRLVRGREHLGRADGSRLWLDVTAAPIPVEGLGVAIAYTDITEQVLSEERLREGEASLKESSDRLEMEVAERTEELRSANAEMQVALEAKSRFLANMSHELRTPLNSIIGFAGVMGQGLAGPLTEEQRSQLAMIGRSGRRLLRLVNDILDLERIEQGHESVSPTDFDLCVLVTEVVEEVSPQAGDKGLSVTVLCPAPVEMHSDRSMVEQIAVNLIDNAVKFTARGSVKIACSTEGPWATLTVTDTGIGIPPEEIDLILDDFHQVDHSDGMKPEGTGLGLSISRRLVEMLGGRLEVESRKGEGSTFTVRLPVSIEP